MQLDFIVFFCGVRSNFIIFTAYSIIKEFTLRIMCALIYLVSCVRQVKNLTRAEFRIRLIYGIFKSISFLETLDYIHSSVYIVLYYTLVLVHVYTRRSRRLYIKREIMNACLQRERTRSSCTRE